MNIVYYIKFEFNYSFIVIYTTMIKKEAVGMNKRVCTAAAVLALYDVHCPCGGCIQLG